MKAADAVTRLESLQPHDDTKAMADRALQEAENILLLMVPPSVRSAYAQAKDRCSWSGKK